MIKRLISVVIFLSLFALFYHPITAINQDLGRHLLTGNIILSTKTIPTVNLFSYTHPDFPFINHHWFSEVIYSLLYSISGFHGVLIFSTAIILLSFFLLYKFVYKDASTFGLMVASIFFLGLIADRTDVRPEIFSALCISIFLTTLFSFQKHPSRKIFFLIPLQILWTNMHIYFPIGLFLIGIFLINDFITNKYKLNQKLFFVTIGVTLATLVNPHGITGALYPFVVLQNYGYSIEENQTMLFLWKLLGKQNIIIYFIGSLWAVCTLLFSTHKKNFVYWSLILSGIILTYMQERNELLLVLFSFIPMTAVTTDVLKNISKNSKTLLTVVLLGTLFWVVTPYIQNRGLGFGLPEYAKNGVDFMIKNKITGPMFNNFDIGSYLEYRLYPEGKVFIDGRPEAYPSSFLQSEYIPMQENPTVFEKLDEKYGFNAVFFFYPDQTPWAAQFTKSIISNPKWSLVYLDGNTIILLKKNEKNKKLISSFEMHPDSLHISDDLKNKEVVSHLLFLFSNLEWKNELIQMVEKTIQIDPNNCYSLYYLGANGTNEALRGMYAQRFTTLCK